MRQSKEQLINDLVLVEPRKPRSSKLDPFKIEVLILRQFNMSYPKISNWLRQEKSLIVSARNIKYMVDNVWHGIDNE